MCFEFVSVRITLPIFHEKVEKRTLRNYDGVEVHENHRELQEHVDVAKIVSRVESMLGFHAPGRRSFLKNFLNTSKNYIDHIIYHQPNESCIWCLDVKVRVCFTHLRIKRQWFRIRTIHYNTDT